MDNQIENLNQHAFSRRDFLKVAGLTGVTLMGLAGCGNTANVKKDAGSAADSATKSSKSKTITVTDMGGTKVEVPTNITKFADGWFAHNEISIMLTGDKGIVATACSKENYPWMYKVAPRLEDATVSFGQDFNFEDLVALEPQVIFDSKDALRDKATEVDIPVVNCMFKTFDEMQKSIELTAKVFGGKAPKIAKKYNAELEKTISDIESKTKKLDDADKPAVLHGNSVYTLTIDGTGTIIDDWIRVAGGRNAVTESTEGNAQAKFSMEQVLAWNPDVIITGNPTEVDQILNDPNWQSIPAVQNKQVYVNPKGVFGWDRYGVEELLQVQWAAKILHPNMFKKLNIEKAVKNFYRDYLDYKLSDDEVKLIMAAKNPEA